MATYHRPNRKVTDDNIIRMNAVGLSLATIAKELHVHPTTVSARLQALGIAPADTRRSFMEDVILGLTPEQQQWLADQVGPTVSIKTVIRNLIMDAYEMGMLRTNQGLFNVQTSLNYCNHNNNNHH